VEIKGGGIFMKITPLHDVSWYIKWVSSIILTIAIACRATNYHEADLWLSLIGITGWGVVGWLWHDRALIFVNAAASTILLTGILREI
tara:strand:+ start:898 stop:1161 length:264 start_codon:yes stop_codon:yes gene_type:complete